MHVIGKEQPQPSNRECQANKLISISLSFQNPTPALIVPHGHSLWSCSSFYKVTSAIMSIL